MSIVRFYWFSSAAWGIFLYWVSPHWSDAVILDLAADYCSPAIACMAVWIRTGRLRLVKDLCKPLRP